MIHPSAIVDAGAKIGISTNVGAYAIVGANVEIGENCWIGPHVVIKGPTRIGKNNRIFQFCSIGEDPQDKKYQGESDSALEIGDNNIIREYCSINRGTGHGGGLTHIGNNNWIMACVHIAHDCRLGNETVLANNTTLAGHVSIDDFVILGGFTGVHQFCRIGQYSFSAIASVILKDVPPFIMVTGNSAKPSGLNKEGLIRNGLSSDTIRKLTKAYKIVYRNGLLLKDALGQLEDSKVACAEVSQLVNFIASSERGIAR